MFTKPGHLNVWLGPVTYLLLMTLDALYACDEPRSWMATYISGLHKAQHSRMLLHRDGILFGSNMQLIVTFNDLSNNVQGTPPLQPPSSHAISI